MVNDRPRRRVVRFGDSDPPPRPTEPDGAAEDIGGISVVVDGAGTVTDVVVPAQWRETVGANALGAALCTAANNALTARLIEQLENIDLDPEPTVVPRPDARDAGGDPSSEVAQDLVNEVTELFAVFGRDLDSYEKQVRENAVTTASERGGNGKIEVTMSPDQVAQVTVDQFWARNARYTEIRAEALGAFQAAGRRLAAGDPSTVALPASLARLRQLAGDPGAFNKQLGLS